MKTFRETIGKKLLVIDGAMGTLLMEGGVRPEEGFDLQNIKRPELIESVHKRYVESGADIIETNTFGANRIKLKDYNAEGKTKEINSLGISIARKAAQNNEIFVCGSIGPLGKFLQPIGEVSFDYAAEVFAEQASAMEEAGADCVSVETISDLQEMRAAVVGIKSLTKLPVIASLTYDENGLTVFGTPPEAAVVVLEALDVDAISANCSTGPEGLLKIAKKLLAASRKPIMVMPNAGMPIIENDRTIYKMSPEKFGKFAVKFAKLGVSIIGGCCGTTPEHIHAVKSKIQTIRPKIHPKSQPPIAKFASRIKVVETEKGKLFVIGERINPTGRKLLKEDIKSSTFNLVREEAVLQTKSKADLLDVNISVPEGQDIFNMKKAVHVVEKASPIPLSIDSSNPQAIEAGLSEFCGRALLNSVNGKDESLKNLLPLAKKYGAAIIGLTLDKEGVPENSSKRFEIAKKIVSCAVRFGIEKKDIFIDTLVMTAGIGLQKSLEALKAIPAIKKKLGVKTSLGISNVSHGLPNRSKINALFLELAILYGLDAAIIDPTDKAIMSKRSKSKRSKKNLIKLIELEIEKSKSNPKIEEKSARLKKIEFKSLRDIENAVIEGDSYAVNVLVNEALAKDYAPQTIIDKGLASGMEIVGDRFSRKIYFLPQVMSSAEAMTQGFALCKAKIPREDIKFTGKVLIATVHGDIHDIGKNIVKMMLENHGFEVIDIGKDVPAQKIVEAVKEHKPNAIALSALLTTTMLEMRTVKEELKKAGLNTPIIIGGAVVTPEYADRIEASYGADAAHAVKLAKKTIEASQ